MKTHLYLYMNVLSLPYLCLPFSLPLSLLHTYIHIYILKQIIYVDLGCWICNMVHLHYKFTFVEKVYYMLFVRKEAQANKCWERYAEKRRNSQIWFIRQKKNLRGSWPKVCKQKNDMTGAQPSWVLERSEGWVSGGMGSGQLFPDNSEQSSGSAMPSFTEPFQA